MACHSIAMERLLIRVKQRGKLSAELTWMQANRFSNPRTGNRLEFYTCNGLRQGARAKAVKGRIVKADDVWGWLWTAGDGVKGWHPASSPLPL